MGVVLALHRVRLNRDPAHDSTRSGRAVVGDRHLLHSSAAERHVAILCVRPKATSRARGKGPRSALRRLRISIRARACRNLYDKFHERLRFDGDVRSVHASVSSVGGVRPRGRRSHRSHGFRHHSARHAHGRRGSPPLPRRARGVLLRPRRASSRRPRRRALRGRGPSHPRRKRGGGQLCAAPRRRVREAKRKMVCGACILNFLQH
mmetsp:Transcript_11650/g.38320  ORF Transcript_11650/g.38320 Transcript_11650/m.38320 type:complete len:206 (+) Transcript_11650:924-1541(+)